MVWVQRRLPDTAGSRRLTMDNAKITFEFVTPCIMAGADQRKAEFRIPSVRGQLIWWLWSLGYGDATIAGIFGGQDEKGQPVSSAYVVRDRSGEIKWSVKDGRDVCGNQYDYFLWPMRGTRNNPDAGKRGVIEPGQQAAFDISYRYRRGALDLPGEVVKACLLLGSMGTRSRRCYGSIWPVSVEIDGEKWPVPRNIAEFKTALDEILDKDAGCRVLSLSKSPREYALSAVNDCAKFLKSFRCGSAKSGKPSKWGKSDHDLNFLREENAEIFRPAIGLPLTQRYSGRDRMTVEASVDGIDRFASPVHFKVVRLEDGYYPIVIFFRNDQLDEGTTVRLQGGRGPRQAALNNDLFIEMMHPVNQWPDYQEIYDTKE